MAEGNNDQPPQPNPALKRLDILVGKWKIKGHPFDKDGEIKGQVTFECLEGGFDHVGQEITGAEYIGYDDSNENLKSYFFSNHGPGPFGRVALEYVWEVGEETLTIWGGYVGSPANFKGKFSDNRNTVTGRWGWPGGGYEVTMTMAN